MKVALIIADEFRPEIGGKQTALGLFADGTVVLEPLDQRKSGSSLPRGIERLSFLVSISDVPSGTHAYKGQIIAPDGKPHGAEMSFGDTVTVEGKSHIVVIVAKPFLVNGTGTYKLKFYVDDTPYELPFKLIDGPLTGPSTT